MRIVSIGGGPAGLYFALLMKRRDASHSITVYERNRPGDTFGWGVVFSDETLQNFAEADPESHREIEDSFAYWSDIEILRPGRERLRSTGHGFCGLERRRLIGILVRRCEELGVELVFSSEIADPELLRAEADLLVAADGVFSQTRDRYAAHFGPELEWGRCRFSWLGAELRLPAFTFIFKENEHGLFQVHAYPFDATRSTFIVECHEDTWRRSGLAEADEAATLAYCQALFHEELGGRRLLANRSIWRTFPTVRNERWHHGNVVLIGDAAHTAHFSVGSGTKLAMEDAIALADAFGRFGADEVPLALAAYEEARRSEVGRLQSAARTSREWFETTTRHVLLDELPFAFSLLSRSKRITWDNLRARDPELVARVGRDFAESNPHRADAGDAAAAEPVFQPFRLRELALANRIVVSPMCQYSSVDGTPGDWHLVHLGSRALGGAGLMFTEATHVSPTGRITHACAGMYRPEHVEAWRRIVGFVHEHTAAHIGMQIAHSGRKGSCRVPWEGGEPLGPEAGAWETVAPSPIPYDAGWPVPRELDRDEMTAIREEFVRATRMADAAGFDILELHMAHGYLLGGFLSPLTNRRRDGYGGEAIEARMRYPLEVFDACRVAWPEAKPLSVRISATDWREGGFSDADRLAFARALKERGCDVVAVSGGQTVADQQPLYGRMYQVPFSDQIRNEAGIPTMVVGNIQNADQCNTILAARRADLCVMARAHLSDPYLTLHAAEVYGYDGQPWPPQYLPARPRRKRESGR